MRAARVVLATRGLHQVELWVPDIARAIDSCGWLLGTLGYEDWPGGRSWRAADDYIVVEHPRRCRPGVHDRRRPDLNHLAFHAGQERDVDRLVAEGAHHGWSLLFPDRHPHASGREHYAGYLENTDGFEVELVAEPR